jgi:nucleotide-binding universal stress UspA family protein
MRVLIVDDQAAVRSALQRLLNEESLLDVVGEVVRAEELLAQAQATQPDLVLLDWELPGLLAANPSRSAPRRPTIVQARRHLLDALHTLHFHPKVIVLSGRPEVRQAALDAGADAFVSKGDPPERLLAALRNISKEVDMYHTLLVPLDGSKRAEAILPHVEELTQRTEAKVILLQVVEPIPIVLWSEKNHPVLDPLKLERPTREAEDYLAALQEKLREKGIKAWKYVAHGAVVETIISVAERENADLIAMASHGRSGLARVFYGSVAAGVLQQVDRPLLIIRSRNHE